MRKTNKFFIRTFVAVLILAFMCSGISLYDVAAKSDNASENNSISVQDAEKDKSKTENTQDTVAADAKAGEQKQKSEAKEKKEPKKAEKPAARRAPVGKKYKLEFDFDMAEKPGGAHAMPGALGQMPEADAAWKNIKISVTDSKNNKKQVSDVIDFHYHRSVDGEYPEGEEVTIEVDTSTLPEGYHLSYTVARESTYFHVIEGGYNIFKVKIDRFTRCRIALGFIDVGFNLKGGNINGNETNIYKRVKKDNTVDFPADPEKANLTFAGWYTETTQGKMYLWQSDYKFSDYNRDWSAYNDPAVDPLYDGVFLLRALWKAKVDFDSNGGSAVDSQNIREGEKAKKPNNPSKKYAEFIGWTDESGNSFDFEKPIMKHMKLTAKWNDYKMPVPKDIVVDKGAEVTPDSLIGNKEEMPQNTEFKFKTPVDTNKTGTQKVVVTVKYPNGDVKDVTAKVTVKSKSEELYKVTFDLNGGNFDGKTEAIVKEYKPGSEISILKAPVRKGYKFLYWKGSKYYPGQKYTVKGNHTFVAQWEKVGASNGANGNGKMPNNRGKSPATGDYTDVFMYLSILTLAGTALIAAMRKKTIK